MSNNAIELQTKQDYERAVEIETEIIAATGWRLDAPDHGPFVTYPHEDLADLVRARLEEEGIQYK